MGSLEFWTAKGSFYQLFKWHGLVALVLWDTVLALQTMQQNCSAIS